MKENVFYVITDTDGNKTIITAENNNPFIIPTAEHAEKLNTANIYLNSIQYGSSYYVKYCYEYSNQLETAINTDIPTMVDFYGDVKLTIANSNGYYEHAGVEGKITASCDIDDIEFLNEDDLDFGDNSIFATSFYTQFIFDLSENFQNKCVFKISFDEERKNHIRELKNGEVNYSANVNTEINYYSDFSY